MAIKDSKYLNNYSVNPLFLIFRNVNGYFEEINKSKYLSLVPTNESKWIIKIYGELWNKIRKLIRLKTKTSDDYDKKYMKISFNSDDKLPLNKTIETPTIIIVLRAIFLANNKYYPQVFLEECLYKLKTLYYDRIDVSEGTSINKTSASEEFNIVLSFNQISVIGAMIC